MSMDTDLQWVMGPKRRKAKQISDDLWKKHENVIRDLYDTTKLGDLITIMRVQYGFEATARQYTARLEAWGVKKYRTKKNMPEYDSVSHDLLNSPTSPSPPIDSISGPSVAGWGIQSDEDYHSEVTEGLKRQRSIKTPNSDIDECALEDLRTAKKSRKVGLEISVDRACSQSSEASQSIGVEMVSKDKSNIAAEVDLSPPPLRPSRPTNSVFQFWTWSRSAPSIGILEAVFLMLKAISMDEFRRNISLPFCHFLTSEVKSLKHLITRSMLSCDNQTRLGTVADFLFAHGHYEESTTLYVLLLTIGGSEEAFSGDFLTPNVISCARSARTPKDCQLVQELFSKQIGRYVGQKFLAAEQFLTHFLLAKVYSQQKERNPGVSQMMAVRNWADDLEKNGDYLLNSSLEILIYVHYKEFSRRKHKSTSVSPSVLIQASQPCFETSRVSHADFLVFRSMLRPNTARLATTQNFSQRIKEFFGWCKRVVDLYDVNSDNPGCRNPIDPEYAPEAKRAPKVTQLFDYLWKEWHRDSPSMIELRKGSIQAESEIGISTPEHLHICAGLIILRGMKNLDESSGEGLASKYLRQLYYRIRKPANTFERLVRWEENMSDVGSVLSSPSSWRSSPVFPSPRNGFVQACDSDTTQGARLDNAHQTPTNSSQAGPKSFIAESLGSSNISMMNFKNSSRAMQRQVIASRFNDKPASSRYSVDQLSATFESFSLIESAPISAFTPADEPYSGYC